MVDAQKKKRKNGKRCPKNKKEGKTISSGIHVFLYNLNIC
jgi:hypothetical protein